MAEENSIPVPPKGSEHRKLLEDRKIAILTMVDVIRTKKHFFILTLTLTILGTLMGHFLKVSTFEATATLFVQDTDQPSAAEYLLNQHLNQMSGSDRVESYVNHLNSDSFLLRVAEKIKFDKSFSNLNMIAPQRKSKLSLAYWKHYFLSDEDHTVQSDREKKLLTPVETIASFLRKTVTYTSQYPSQFIAITSTTLDPETSQLIANLIAEEFVTITNKHNLNELKEIEAFIGKKKQQTEDKVRELDSQLVAFKQKNKMISADATTKSFAQRLANLDSQIQDSELKQKENKKLLELVTKGQKKSMDKLIKDGSRSLGFATAETSFILQSRIEQLKKEKSAYLAQGVDETNFRLKKINDEIDSSVALLQQNLSSSQDFNILNPQEVTAKIARLKDDLKNGAARIGTLKNAKTKLESQVNVLPNIQQEYIQLENSFKTEIDALANLERKEKELEIQRISYKKEVRLDQVAETPGATPRGSLFMKLLFSSFAALFLGLLIVLALESLDPTVKSRQDLYDCGLEFFGEVPFVTNPDRAKKRSGRFQFGSPEDLVCKNNPESVESMSFKYMRARIESMRYKEKKDCQIITFSSALHNEGKSFVASNLSISLAQLNRKVLLIDADLRRPSQSAYFGLSSQSGLIDLLSVKKNLDEVLVTDQYNNLHILPAGFSGTESTELISSQKFRLLIEHLRSEYDYIVIDTPPTFAVVDAAIISSFSDIPILVSSFRTTRKADLYEAYNDLLQVSYKKVFGVINKAIVSNSRIHYYGYPIYENSANEISAFSANKDEDAEEFLKALKKRSS